MISDDDSTPPAGSSGNPPESAPPAARRRTKREGKAKELAAALSGLAALTGTVLPDEERMAPRLNVQLPDTALARALAQHLRNEPLFRRASSGALITVSPAGEMEAMTPLRFVTWAEERVTFTKDTARGESVVSLSVEKAARILASDSFRGSLRPLRTVNLVRLPTWSDPERTGVKLMGAGYDEGTQSFTVDTVPYVETMEPDRAYQFFLDAFAEFPFARPDNDPVQPLSKNRSFAVQIAGMLAVFCRPMLSGSLRPAFAIQANQAGSGKTLLLRTGITPVFGPVTVQSAPRDENELGKLLTATAAEGHDYLVLDNVSGYFASAELESFLTSPRRRGRILGHSQTVDAENTLNVFITGNGLTISPDLARRCLLCDLWFAGDVLERRITRPIDEEWLSSPECRAGYLAALWSLVNHWGQLGCPRSTGARLASYETFSAVIGGIVMSAAFADPIARPEVRLDETQQAWTTLFRALAASVPDGDAIEYDLDTILETAKEAALLEILTGDAKNPKVSMGKRLSKWRGRQLIDSRGRPFEFGHRHSAVGAKYKVRILTPAPLEDGS